MGIVKGKTDEIFGKKNPVVPVPFSYFCKTHGSLERQSFEIQQERIQPGHAPEAKKGRISMGFLPEPVPKRKRIAAMR